MKDPAKFLVHRVIFVIALLMLGIVSSRPGWGAEPALHGIVLDADTNKPIPFVTAILDSSETRICARDGSFDFGPVSPGPHRLAFEHIAYQRLVLPVRWPAEVLPLVIKLNPSPFVMEEIIVEGDRAIPSFPVSATTFTRKDLAGAVGNIANDPLRTIQTQPSCAVGGLDFLSKTAVRGGDTKEHNLYFDDYPLMHSAHVGGFAGLVYDDMLESTVLVPGTVPIRYRGNLSGIVLLKPARADTSFNSFRFDITSMAGGVSRIVSPSLSFQLSAKTSFFNLPVYQEAMVNERSFRDLMGRVHYAPNKSFSLTTTVLMAMDREEGYASGTARPERRKNSVLAGIKGIYRASRWELVLRPSFSLYDFRDGVTWSGEGREHRLEDAGIHAELSRQSTLAGFGLFADAGTVSHTGSGGNLRDSPYSAAAELRLSYQDHASLMLGGGGSREPWTSRFEPEAYGSVWFYLGDIATVSSGFRRSHQTPFLFNHREHFAAVPVDAGDLLQSYQPSWRRARAVRMDQASVNATIHLPLNCKLEYNGFRREYDRLLTWEWDDFPVFNNVGSRGEGHGDGYEIIFRRNDPGFLSIMAALSRARVFKREGTLGEERLGDYDRPFSWQAGFSIEPLHGVRLALRWMAATGRPYTPYGGGSDPPAQADINTVRMLDFERLDVKLSFRFVGEPVAGEGFVDVINFRDRGNLVDVFAVETASGGYSTVRAWGTRFFPIVGVTIRW